MAQWVFYKFAQQFVINLPINKGPIILLLDGHGSHWSVPAQQLLRVNHGYTFFLASHTLIWSQPNDCRCNVQFQNCLKKCFPARLFQTDTPKVTYFNMVFLSGWRLFLDLEQEDLLSTRGSSVNKLQQHYKCIKENWHVPN